MPTSSQLYWCNCVRCKRGKWVSKGTYHNHNPSKKRPKPLAATATGQDAQRNVTGEFLTQNSNGKRVHSDSDSSSATSSSNGIRRPCTLPSQNDLVTGHNEMPYETMDFNHNQEFEEFPQEEQHQVWGLHSNFNGSFL